MFSKNKFKTCGFFSILFLMGAVFADDFFINRCHFGLSCNKFFTKEYHKTLSVNFESSLGHEGGMHMLHNTFFELPAHVTKQELKDIKNPLFQRVEDNVSVIIANLILSNFIMTSLSNHADNAMFQDILISFGLHYGTVNLFGSWQNTIYEQRQFFLNSKVFLGIGGFLENKMLSTTAFRLSASFALMRNVILDVGGEQGVKILTENLYGTMSNIEGMLIFTGFFKTSFSIRSGVRMFKSFKMVDSPNNEFQEDWINEMQWFFQLGVSIYEL